MWVQLALDVVAPLVLFYALRQMGQSVLVASVIGGTIPTLRALYSLVRGNVDLLGIAMMSMFIVGTVVAYITGDPRLVFAKDGWLTGMLGVWAIVSLLTKRPFMMHLGRMIATAKKGTGAADVWERRWSTEPEFRRRLFLVSFVVGIVLIVDAVVRVAIAYLAPIDAVPLITNVQYVVMLGLLLSWFFPYTARSPTTTASRSSANSNAARSSTLRTPPMRNSARGWTSSRSRDTHRSSLRLTSRSPGPVMRWWPAGWRSWDSGYA